MKILLTGGTGMVGSRFIDLTSELFEIIAPSSDNLDILNPGQIEKALVEYKSEVCINFAAYTNVDEAQEDVDDEGGLVYRLNALAPANIAKICRELNVHFIHISTDYVFDGKKEDEPYKEDDEPKALNWYGVTKLHGEQFVQDISHKFTIARIEMPYCTNYIKKMDFARFFLQSLKSGKEITAVSDQKITPIFVDSAVKAITKLAQNKAEGIFHLASTDFTSPFEFALMIAEQCGLDKSLIKGIKFEEFNANRKASRPKNSWLSTSKFNQEFSGILLNVEGSIKQFCSEIT